MGRFSSQRTRSMFEQYSSEEQDAIAARAAIATWFGNNGQTAEKIQHQPVDLAVLKSWLSFWILARTVGSGRREAIRDFLNHTARGKLLEPSASCETVEQLSAQVKTDGIMPGRPTSLISKFAFTLRPESFVPYDRRVRGALNALGYRVKAHHYCDYLRGFRLAQETIVERCRATGLSPAKLRYQGKTLDNALFDARLAYKRLMLQGGFSASRMKKDYKLNDFS
jgi:hypothetical protein